MFIRRTQTRRMADGARYTTCRLVRNERIGDRAGQNCSQVMPRIPGSDLVFGRLAWGISMPGSEISGAGALADGARPFKDPYLY